MGVILDESDFLDSGPRILSEDDFMPEQPKLSLGREISDRANATLQGLTFGFGDEMAAGFGAAIGRDYDTELQRIRRQLGEYRQRAPYGSAAYEVAGGLVPALMGGAGVAGKAGQIAQKAPGAVSKIARAIGLGGGYGAAYGFGAGEGGVANRAEQAAESGLIGALTGGAVEGGITAVGKAVAPIRRGLGRAGDSYIKDGLGIRSSDTQQGVRKAVDYLDEAGNVTTLDNAVTRRGLLERNLQLISEDGLLDSLATSDRNKIATIVAQRTSQLSRELEPLVMQADAALQQSATTTGARIRFRPDFSRVRKWISDKAPADMEDELYRLVDAEERAANARSGSLLDLLRGKEKLARARDFKGTESALENEKAQVRRLMYGAYREATENAFDVAAQMVDPKLAGKLKQTNLKLSAYHSLDEPLSRPQTWAQVVGTFPSVLGKAAAGTLLGVGTGLPAAAAAPVVAGAIANSFPIQTGRLLRTLANAPTAERVISGASPLVAAITGAARVDREGASGMFQDPTPTAEASLLPDTPNLTSVVAARPSAAPDMPDVVSARFVSNLAKGKGVEPMLPDVPTQAPKPTAATVEPTLPEPSVKQQILKAIKATERSRSDQTSPKGAKGTFQLMDATGREYHRRLGIKEAYDPTKDSQAEQIAGAFIDDLIKKYRDPLLVAAGYNMGEKNLDRFISKYGPNWEDIEPHLKGDFLETKKYVPYFVKQLGMA